MDFRKKTIRDVDVKGKNVLVRVDYNVPLVDGQVAEDMRIRESLPTLKYLAANGARRIILISHLGRPNGEKKEELSLAPTAERLARLATGKLVTFVKDIDADFETELRNLPNAGIMMLENLRFWPGEEANSEEFARKIIAKTHADIFVQDGFAVTHRAHASTDAIARMLPSVAGLLVEKEVMNLESVSANPEHPVLLIIGGAKVADKQPLIDRFLPIADKIAVGGKIAADGYVPTSEKVFVANGFTQNTTGEKLDIDEASANAIISMMNGAKTIIWNGTMGMTEEAAFSAGSRKIAEAMGRLEGVKTIVGGGDTAGYVESLMREDGGLHYDLVSTGGGASLELLLGRQLPGVEILSDR